MKKVKNIYSTVCLTGLLAVVTTSCQDWLTIYPQDRVVEEEFWEDKKDLEGVRYGAYRQMANTVSKLAVWGDLRSDTYRINRQEDNSQSDRIMYIDIMNGQPDSSMNVFDWGGVYNTINLCNKVLQHGEEVLEKDKQFTTQEWSQMKAEMTALRSLNYFYLLRAFKDIPYTKRVINKDDEVTNDTLTPQLQVLDSCILDCERVKGKARDRFADKADSKGMITNSAIYAMLADMCLWRASLHEGRHDKAVKYPVVQADGSVKEITYSDDYLLASAYADTCLMRLAEQNLQEQISSASDQKTAVRTKNWGLGSNCEMIENIFVGANESQVPKLEAQTEIFFNGNSVESIFELQFSTRDGLTNSIVNSLYGYNKGTHLEIEENALKSCYNGGIDGEDDANGGKWDSRLWIACQKYLKAQGSNSGVSDQPGYYCMKYSTPNSGILQMTPQTQGQKIESITYNTDSYKNWIVYRMTDVMLIKAEALVHSGAKKDALTICTAIRRRSYCNYKEAKTPNEDASKFTGPGTIATSASANDTIADTWVLNERQIELLGEGKRWFDLVRFAERYSFDKDGKNDPKDSLDSNVPNGFSGMKKMVNTFLKAANPTYATTLQNRFKNRWGLYCPIYYMDVKASDHVLRQNPVWNKSKYEQ